MEELVNINGTDIGIKEYKGQRVVTFKDIDRVHERAEGTARRNFANNKERFIEGEHYFIVTPETLANSKLYEFRTSENFEANNRGTALITEKGYLKLVKSFNDDLAWEVQDRLIDGYFQSKNNKTDLSPQTQLLYGMLDQMAENERQVREAKALATKSLEMAEAIKEAVTPIVDDWRKAMNEKILRITKRSDKPYDEIRNEMYQQLEQRAGCDLGKRVRNLQSRMADRGCKRTDINNVNKISVIESDKRLREVFAKIVSEYEIRYCV